MGKRFRNEMRSYSKQPVLTQYSAGLRCASISLRQNWLYHASQLDLLGLTLCPNSTATTLREQFAMGTCRSAPRKLHLFDMPPPLLASVIESLEFRGVVGMVDFIMLSSKKGRKLWHAQIKRMLRCPDMDNRKYSEGSLRWVLKRDITMRNFTTQELKPGMTELHYAVHDDKAWIARACITCNDDDDINAPNAKGYTPLHMACMKAHIDVVKLLLESGAQQSLYHKDKGDGDIPIEIAIQYEKVEKVKLLLSCHEKDKELARKNLGNLGDALRLAAELQNLEIVKLILGVWPDIIHSHSPKTSNTALHQSCVESDKTAVMKFLLTSGAGVNAVDNHGCTPLFTAARSRHPECTKVLLAAGASVNHVNDRGSTPLDRALARGDYAYGEATAKIVELLESAGGLRAAQLPDDDNDSDNDNDNDNGDNDNA